MKTEKILNNKEKNRKKQKHIQKIKRKTDEETIKNNKKGQKIKHENKEN